MTANKKWPRILYGIGMFAVIVGALDPLEGSVVIAAGSFMVAVAAYIMHDHYRMTFLAVFIMVVTGVFFLFYFSSLGGFGGRSSLSWWWGILVLPYPAGWVMAIGLFIMRQRRITKQRKAVL